MRISAEVMSSLSLDVLIYLVGDAMVWCIKICQWASCQSI